MIIETLTNRTAPLELTLSDQLQTCSSFNIAVAFIDTFAIDLVEQALKSPSLKQGTLLIGVFECFNKQTDLFRLSKLAAKFSSKFSVRISKDKRFHCKYYQFANQRYQNVFVGSANFTNAGISRNGEMLISICDKLSNKSTVLAKLDRAFADELANSGPISEFRIDLYRERKQEPKEKNRWPEELEKFFDSKAHDDADAVTEKAVLLYRTDSVSKETELKLENYKPGWQDKTTGYFICNNKREFENCKNTKKYLIISRQKRGEYYFLWAKYLGDCELKTRDGKYFIGYEYLSKEKKVTKAKLKKITSKDGFGFKLEGRVGVLDTKVLGKQQTAEIESMLS